MTFPKTADLVVVGGGIVGIATAAAAAARGAKVVVIEKEAEPAIEASGRAQGSLRVQGRHGAEFPLALESLDLWKEAAEDGDFEFKQGGNMYFQTRPEERATLDQLIHEAHESGLCNVEFLTPDEVREVMPAATGPFYGAMYSQIDAQAQPHKATKYFARRAEQNGATLCFGTKATGIRLVRGGINALETSRGTISTSRVVIAGGIWTPYLAHSVGVEVPIMPVVMSELETAPLPQILEPTVRAFGFGARQRLNGRTVISAGLNAKVTHKVSFSDMNGLGYWLPRAMAFRKALRIGIDVPNSLRQIRYASTRDTRLIPDSSPEPDVDYRSVTSALERMSKVIPAFKEAEVTRYWGGFVDMTPDGLPIIDGSIGVHGLSIITGLAGHGLHLGPVLGEIGAELALDGETTRPIEPFRLSRFKSGNIQKPELMI